MSFFYKFKKGSSPEPKSDYARYAFGYSDKKPGASFWIIHAILILIILLGLSACGADEFTLWIGKQRQECIKAGGNDYSANSFQLSFVCWKKEILYIKTKEK